MHKKPQYPRDGDHTSPAVLAYRDGAMRGFTLARTSALRSSANFAFIGFSEGAPTSSVISLLHSTKCLASSNVTIAQ
jgi:hypothetical protein